MGSDVDFGLFLPRWSSRASPEAWKRIARAAEESGFDYVGRGDHVAFPPHEGSSWGPATNAYDVFTVLSFVAGVTSEVRIGTNICVVPYRHPIHLAKLALSLDALSEGRFEFGVAVGWLEEEFEALDVPFEERGSRTDEFLDLFERICEEEVVSFDGSHHRFEEVGFHPRPVQSGGPPVLVGGRSGPAFRRAAQFGEGWLVTDVPDGIREGRERLLRAWDDFDREGEPAIAAGQGAYVGDADGDGPLVGPADAVIEGVEAYVDAGAARIDVKFDDATDSLEEHVEQVERFGGDVAASF